MCRHAETYVCMSCMYFGTSKFWPTIRIRNLVKTSPPLCRHRGLRALSRQSNKIRKEANVRNRSPIRVPIIVVYLPNYDILVCMCAWIPFICVGLSALIWLSQSATVVFFRLWVSGCNAHAIRAYWKPSRFKVKDFVRRLRAALRGSAGNDNCGTTRRPALQFGGNKMKVNT